jgi:hypothetical protein
VNVRNGKLITLLLGANLAMFGAACSSASGNEEDGVMRPSGSGDARSGDEVTIAGCLSGTEGRFALTATPDATGAIAGRAVGGDERETHSYILVGNANMQQHVGKRVEVIGTVEGGSKQLEHEAEKKNVEPDATGSGDKPTVKTAEDVEVQVRQLNVREVRAVAGDCSLTK